MAVAGGYAGTLEEFEVDIGNSGTNAANAAASASAAAASAESIADSAAQIATNTGDISDLKTQINQRGIPTGGTTGQSLRKKSGTNYDMEWADVGLPTDEQTADAVSAWLDDHPEATTTVEDESLTYKKLVTGTLGFVTPEMFGATGDGETDDTEALQATFNSGYDVLLLNEYVIKERLDISKQIKIEGGKLIADFIGICLNITSDNVVIDGLEIDGGNKAYRGIYLNQVANTIIKNCTIHHFSATSIPAQILVLFWFALMS